MTRRVLLLAFILLCLLGPSVDARLLGGGGPIDRGGNRPWAWCPCSNARESGRCVRFSTDGRAVLVRFRAVTHTTIDKSCCYVPDSTCVPYLDTYDPPPLKYMKQRIDNLMVVESADFLANLEPRAGACGENCDTLFAFDHLADKKFAYRELFDSGVDATWDLTHGAFFDPTESGPASLGDPSNSSVECPDTGGTVGPFSGQGGSLGFGSADSPPTPPECCPQEEFRQYVNTRTLVSGLKPNTPYVLSFWWASHRDENCLQEPGNVPLRNGDLTVSVFSCDMAMDFRCASRQLNLSAHGGYLTGYLEPPLGHTIAELDLSTITLNGRVHPAAGFPPETGDFDSDGIPDLKLRFARTELQAVLSAGSQVPISVSGFASGDLCFDGTDFIRVRAPRPLQSPTAGSVLTPGSQFPVRWSPGRGTVDLLVSFDDGLNWRVEATSIPNNGNYSWTVPWIPTQNARLAVGKVLTPDATGLTFDSEVGEAGPFAIATTSDVVGPGATVAVLGVSPNPTRRSFTVAFSLASSAPASVTVYDVKGRLVAVNPVTELGPGMHTMTFGARSSLPAGIYLVRLTQAGKSVTARATVIP